MRPFAASSRQGPMQLKQMLEEALHKEAAWRPNVYRSPEKKVRIIVLNLSLVFINFIYVLVIVVCI